MSTLGRVLDQYCRGRMIDLLKIDAEGAEAAILRGGRLAEFRPKLIIIEAMVPYRREFDASQRSSRNS